MLLLNFTSPKRRSWANKDDQRPPLHSGWYTSTFTFCHFEIGPLSLSSCLWQILHLYFPPLREKDPIFILVEINTLQQTWKLRNKFVQIQMFGKKYFQTFLYKFVNEFPLGKLSYQFVVNANEVCFNLTTSPILSSIKSEKLNCYCCWSWTTVCGKSISKNAQRCTKKYFYFFIAINPPSVVHGLTLEKFSNQTPIEVSSTVNMTTSSTNIRWGSEKRKY